MSIISSQCCLRLTPWMSIVAVYFSNCRRQPWPIWSRDGIKQRAHLTPYTRGSTEISFCTRHMSVERSNRGDDGHQLPLRAQWYAKEQWRLLFSFHDKLIRDAAFTIFCPSLLANSQEGQKFYLSSGYDPMLTHHPCARVGGGTPFWCPVGKLPTVDLSILTCRDDSWRTTIEWLRALDPDEVSRWFAGRRRNSRLGDHFADCCEFVLRFCPSFQPSNLEISKQVHRNVPYTPPASPPSSFLPHRSNKKEKKEKEEKEAGVVLECDGDDLPTFSPPPKEREEESGPLPLSLDAPPCYHPPGKTNKGEGDETEVEGREEWVGSVSSNGRRKSRRDRKASWRAANKCAGVTTVGEFDVLFTIDPDPDQDLVGTSDQIHHWELTIKFLLFIAPPQPDPPLGSYLGPHCGESLGSRKDRLCRQLRLGHTEEGGRVVREVYGGGRTVVPAALVAGYLFYNYPLWREMRERGYTITRDGEEEEVSNRQLTCGSVQGGQSVAADVASRVNPFHWSGWWSADLNQVVTHPEASMSRWYIIPKLEWLSPVIILGAEEEGGRRVLVGKDVLEVSRKVGEEASAMNLPKKLRFLIAEVQWVEDLSVLREEGGGSGRAEGSNGGKGVGDASDICRENEVNGHTGDRIGGWVEVSRGCLVEDTWPQTKEARAHGLITTQSSVLQKV